MSEPTPPMSAERRQEIDEAADLIHSDVVSAHLSECLSDAITEVDRLAVENERLRAEQRAAPRTIPTPPLDAPESVVAAFSAMCMARVDLARLTDEYEAALDGLPAADRQPEPEPRRCRCGCPPGRHGPDGCRACGCRSFDPAAAPPAVSPQAAPKPLIDIATDAIEAARVRRRGGAAETQEDRT